MQPAKFAYGVAEACEALSISRNRVYQAIADGTLKTYKDGRRRMVSAKALADYVARKESESREVAA